MSRKSPKPTLEEWKEATWQYLLEHCDVTDNGALFVKFHTDSKYKFEKRIEARLNGYSRKDTRLDLDAKEKDQLAKQRRKEHEVSKETRRMRWEKNRDERRAVFLAVKKANERQILLRKFPPYTRPLINRWLDFYATARIRLVQYRQAVTRLLRSSRGRI